jgi:hypothetical protein
MKRFFRKVGKALGKVGKYALPVVGALIGGWAGGKIGAKLGGVFGKTVGKAVGGVKGSAIGAKLGGSAGRVIGGVVGGIAGSKLGSSVSDGVSFEGLRGSHSINMHIPPYAQKGADILMQLLNQTPNFAQTTANLTRPYIDRAISSMETMPSDLRSIYSEAESEIRRNFGDLLTRQQNIIQSEQARQNLKLGALGLLNTQAQQWTMADILNRTAFETLRDQTTALTNLTGAKTQSLANYLFMRPEFYANITDKLVQTNPQLLEYQTKMDIAKALMGVPTIVQPKYRKGLFDYLPAFGQLATAFMLLRR